MKQTKKKPDYGPVYIINGEFKGRVGHYDDDDVDQFGKEISFVYLVHPLLSDEFIVSLNDMTEINTSILINRQRELGSILMDFHFTDIKDRKNEDYKEHFYNANEYLYIESILHQNFIKARFMNVQKGKRVFISHSSKDKTFVKF